MLAALQPIVDVLGTVVGENVEVVLHDMTRPESSVVKIVNGHVSGRSIGDSILKGPIDDKGFIELTRNAKQSENPLHSLLVGYTTRTRDGRELRSSTVIFRDSNGTPFVSLCINTDLSVVFQAHALLQSMLYGTEKSEPSSKASPGVDVLMQEIIADAVRRFGKPISMMNKEEKVHAVNIMLQRGLFIVKGGVEHAATALGVTRFTIYNYLDILKRKSVDQDLLPPRLSRRDSSK